MLRCFAALFGCFLAAGTSASKAADTFRSEAATLRLVLAHPSPDGRVRAALLIDLRPGWKTYWLDPGEAGISPRLDLAASRNIDGATAHFPAPHRFDDGFARSIVYSAPFAVAIDAGVPKRGAPVVLSAAIALGVCRDVCVPLSAQLTAASGDPVDERTVEAAFTALPQASGPAIGITRIALSPDRQTLRAQAETQAPDETPLDLFVAGRDGWSFGPPSTMRRDGRRVEFALPVTARPRRGAARPPVVDAVLTAGEAAYRSDAVTVPQDR